MQANQGMPSLNGWATMSEVSDALGVKHNTVRQTVRRAILNHQDWVKREPYPTPNDPARWLINTSHAIYRYHERRWQNKTRAKQGMASGSAPAVQQHRLSPQTIEVTETWPELCRWLAKRGLVVFVNTISDDQLWQWTWMGNAGFGYPDATAAITAAIQETLSLSDLFYSPAYLGPTEAEQPVEPEEPLWRSLFRRKW